MRALQLVAWNHDPELREVAEPDPGPGEVVVKVGGAGACHSDLHLLHDFPPGLLPFEIPFTLGHENAGWVHAVGAGVDGLEIGQPVALYGPWGCGRCRMCRRGIENYCEEVPSLAGTGGGLGHDGGMAPLMRVPSMRHLVPLDELDPVDAAPLTDAGLTPYHAIMRSHHLLVAGSSAVVIGVGGLGHLAVQILRAITPARIIAVDQRDAALLLAEAAGAHHTVAAGSDAVARIHDLTGGRRADVVIDCVGVASTLELGAAVSRPLGHVTLVGIGGGSFTFNYFSLPFEVSLASTYWGTYTELIEVIALAEAGHLRPRIERYGLEEAPEVYRRLAAGEIEGRAVVVPN